MFKTRVTRIQKLQKASLPITTTTTLGMTTEKRSLPPVDTTFGSTLNLIKNDKQAQRPTSALSTSSLICPQNLSKRKRLEKIIKENIKNEFGIGIIKILYKKNIVIKLFWTLVLGGVLGLSLYLIIQNFLVYFSYGVTTQRRQIYETPTVFPQINICNQNPVTTQYGYNRSVMDSNFLTSDLGLLSKDEQLRLGHNLSDILLSCTFNNLPCTTDDFNWYFDRNLGNCYQFNSGFNSTNQSVDLYTSIRAGADYGLQMTLYSGYYESLSSGISFNGLIVKMVNQSFIDLSDGVYLAPGFITNVAIERFFETLLPQPFSSCVIPNDWSSQGFSDLFNAILNSPYQYSQELCLNLCYQQDVISSCGCNPYDFPVRVHFLFF